MSDQLSAELRRLVDLVPAASDLTTRQINTFSRGSRALSDKNLDNFMRAPLLEASSVAIQAALMAGWFPGVDIKPNQVEDAAPRAVIALGEAIIRAYYEAQQLATAPPEKN